MENQINVGNQNTQQMGQNPVNQPVFTPEKPKTNYLLIGGIVLACFVIFGFGGYYLGKQSSTYKSNLNNTQNQLSQTATPESNSPTTVPTNQPVSTLPSDWSYKDSGECGVKFAIPPKTEPYYIPYDPNRQPSVTKDEESGRYWQFREGVNSLFQFTNLATAIFASDTEASGYISGAVNVYCAENSDKYDSKQLLNQLNFFLAEGQGSVIKIKTFNGITKWNLEAYEITFEGGMFNSDQKYYLLASPTNWYLITKISKSSSKFVQDTTNKIFDNLLFK